ncbi:1,2-phenylacetyl-CoA epoxidase subunit PaaE [Roseivirga sp.]|uniref:1,2-phenylacetyl-CoA epoxidase subunit PaaE n=1 Tax=Roseivirga sp. TaxID=1964215 RepID=UPI003B530144
MAFYPLKVKDLSRPTEDSVAVSFQVPDNLKEEFRYIQGQYLTLRQTINGDEVRRSYSICSCPLDDELTVAIKRVEGGLFSNYANNELQVGDSLEVMPPNGRFYSELNPDQAKSYVTFAGGSGITPIISIIETTLRTEPESEVTLFYANRKSSAIIFQERLEALKNKYMNRFSIHHVLSDEVVELDLYQGFIDQEKIRGFAQLFFDVEAVDEFFTCGPEPMMLSIRESLIELGVPTKKIHMELFTSPLGKLGGGKKKEQSHEKAKSEVTVVLDGNNYTFPYDSSESILDVAIQNGLDLPFACKGGVCSTCICQVEEGEVDMEVNYALEPDELANGMVLSCQSHPKTEKVKLNFDV